MISNTCYELINTAHDLIKYWKRILANPEVVLSTVDPWREYRENHVDYYRYLAWAESYDQSEENY